MEQAADKAERTEVLTQVSVGSFSVNLKKECWKNPEKHEGKITDFHENTYRIYHFLENSNVKIPHQNI